MCGLGPATMLLRNMNSMLRSDVVGEEAPALCLVVQRKHGGGREVANLDELLRALYLLPSSCAGRWQVGCFLDSCMHRMFGLRDAVPRV